MISMFKKKIQPGLSPGRIEALADSIFGFAITLLVLAFIVPELSEAQLAKGELYGATLVVIGILFACMWRYATRGRFLMDHRLSDALIQKGSVIVWVAPLVYFCAVILSFLAVEASILIYLLVPVFYALPGAVDELVEAAA